MKLDLTNLIIIALVIVVIVLPASLYAYSHLQDGRTPSISDYCGANGYLEVFPCTDGSFQAIREEYTEGFSIIKKDGSRLDCPFTLPQYQEGECRGYTTAGTCGYAGNICGMQDACVSDIDCPGEKCVNWTCS
jgi:hypothetical protein